MKYSVFIIAALMVGCTESKIVDQTVEPEAESSSPSVPSEPLAEPTVPLVPSDPAPEPSEPSDPVPEPAVPSDPAPAPIEPLVSGERANWLRGSWGINWKPVDLENGGGETLTIDRFLEQISEFKTIDFLQIHLGDSYIKSPVHIGPNDLLESLWQGDLGDNGKPFNLVVPRAASGKDPFLDILVAIKAAGLKTMIYLNSSNMLEREDEVNPDSIPNITERWKAFCDTDPEVQAFLATESHHFKEGYPNRPYMFCYAEFVLKDYAVRYGDLVDSWLFDSGDTMVQSGDNATNGEPQDQLIYKAFTDAARAGNPNVAVSYNNGPERETEALNPFSEAVLHEDYMFGHPYNGGRKIGDHENGLYDRNYAHMQKITQTSGNIHEGGQWAWDDKVVGHFDPPMSTTSWKGGSTPALTDEEFMLWNLEATRGGGAISWGAPLINATGALNQLMIQDWGMAQLRLMDDHLSINQAPGAPNWARAETPLKAAAFGQNYSHQLSKGVDFWDPESDAITLSIVSAGSAIPNWLTIAADSTGNWLLSGVPTEVAATNYEFILRAEDDSGTSDRLVSLDVGEAKSAYPFSGNIEILATAETNYGINTIATMTSDKITAPDNLATFKLAFDVTPIEGQEIVSSDTSDSTIPQSWGVGSDAIFRGDDGELIKSIDNVRVVNFNANGSDLSATDISNFSFEFATVSDAQSSGDNILIDVNGVTNADDGGNLTSNPDALSLKILGYVPITSFVIGAGTDLSNNKWSISGINVSYIIQSP